MVERGMSFQVSGESEVELKCLRFVKKGSPLSPQGPGTSGARKILSQAGCQSFPFIGQGKAKRTRERGKEEREKKPRDPISGATPSSPFSWGALVLKMLMEMSPRCDVDGDRDGSMSWPVCYWRHARASLAGRGTPFHPRNDLSWLRVMSR
jgi:hypothetical protein